MRYRFIQAEKALYPVEVLCQVLTVARSGYYAWCRRPLSVRTQQNQWLMTHIRTCYQASRGRSVWESADLSGSPCPGDARGTSSRGPPDAAPGTPQCQSMPGLETIQSSRA